MLIYTLNQFIKNNVHLGHYTWECDYRLSYFLLGIRNYIHIINIYNSLYILKRVLYLIYNLGILNQRILLVNNINYKIESVLNNLKTKKLWYVNSKWIGGSLTNQRDIYRNNDKLFYKYYNLGHKAILPSFVFVSNIENTSSCIFEAIVLNIPNSSLFDSNLGFYGIFYKLCANDENFSIMNLFTRILAKTFIKSLYDKKKLLIKRRKIKNILKKKKNKIDLDFFIQKYKQYLRNNRFWNFRLYFKGRARFKWIKYNKNKKNKNKNSLKKNYFYFNLKRLKKSQNKKKNLKWNDINMKILKKEKEEKRKLLFFEKKKKWQNF